MEPFSRLRFEIEASKMTLVQALDDRHEDLKRMVSDAMDRAIPEIGKQIDSMVYEAAFKALSRVVDDAAESAIDLLTEDTAEKLQGAITAAIRKRFTT